jgi:hypothetical protein
VTLSRRSLITGLVSLVAAPAIVRASSLMPVKATPLLIEPFPIDTKLLEIQQWLEEVKRRTIEAMIYPPVVVDQSGMPIRLLRPTDNAFRLVYSANGQSLKV